MARSLSSITLVQPSGDPAPSEGGSFTLEISKTFVGGGDVNAHDVRAEWSTDDANWNVVTTTGDISTTSTNPQLAQEDTGNDTWTIDCNTAGTYYIRANADRNGGDNLYDTATASQQVTVTGATINDVTLQDLDSCAVEDTAVPTITYLRDETLADLDSVPMDQPPARKRTMVTVTEGIPVADALDGTVSEAPTYTINEKTLTDSIEFDTGQATTWFVARWTPVELLNVRDHVEHEVVSAGETAINEKTLSDSIAVTDGQEPERSLRLTLLDDATVADAALVARERHRTAADAAAVADALAAERSTTRALADATVVTDALEAERLVSRALADQVATFDALEADRKRYRTTADALAVDDTALPEYIGTGTINDKTVSDSVAVEDAPVAERSVSRALVDTAAVEDALVGDRYRYRTTGDALAVEDTALPELIGSGTINDVTLSDAVSVTDLDAAEYQLDRALLEAILMEQLPARRRLVSTILEAIGTVSDTAIGQLVTELINAITAEDQVETVEDLLVAERLVRRALFDSVTATDTAIAGLQGLYQRTLADSLSADDYAEVLLSLRRELADSAAVADSMAVRRYRFRALADAETVLDVVDVQRALRRLLGDNLELLDSVTVTLVSEGTIYNRTLSDAAPVEDVLGAMRSLHLVTLDNTTLSDNLPSSTIRTAVLVDDALTVTDAASAALQRIIAAILTEDLAVQDVVQLARRWRVRLTDVSLVDDNAIAAHLQLGEVVSLDAARVVDTITASVVPWAQAEVYILLDVIDSGEVLEA